MNTTERKPAAAEAAATALARLPVDAQATVVKPIAREAESATATTRSLNEWVGLPESSLTHSVFMPRAAASRSALTRRVQPTPRSTRYSRGGDGISPSYRQMERGPGPMDWRGE